MSRAGIAIPHFDPSMRRQGVQQFGVSPPTRAGTAASAGRGPASVVNAAPSTRIERAYFHMLQVNTPAIPAGMAAVYGLRRIAPNPAIGLGVALMHVSAELLPSDSGGTGAGFPDPLAWGDVKGVSAAIVIGKGLDMEVGTWRAAWYDLPGIDLGNAAAVARTLRNTQQPTSYYAVFNFPAGAYSDADVLLDVRERPLAATAARIVAGESLDVALVVKGDNVNGLSGTISGFANVSMVCVDLRADPALGR